MRIPITLSLLAASVASGCTSSDDGQLATDNAAVCQAVNDQSMIETDPAIVTEASFSLHKVFDQIRLKTPSGVAVPASATAMFQELYSSFADCTSDATLDPNHYGLSCRSPEATFASLDPFAPGSTLHYTPVALVNRFDLAPGDFSTCGESRIVFWKTSGPAGRAAIIVEMRTPPVVTNGVKSCVPVANFWASLSNVTDKATRASMLASFFFKGLKGMPFPPVSANGVGFSGRGQVRLNSFVSFAQWNLREFKWKKVCDPTTNTCSAHFLPQTVKNNPSQLLFAGTHPKAASFQSWFVSTATPALAAATDPNAIALGNADGFNTYESVSQPQSGDPTSVLYDQAASATLRANVQAKLTAIGSTLTASDIFQRATTQSCGGCHEVSNGASLGGGIVWPASGGFVQIDETGSLSPALTGTFLPHRITVLENFLCGTGAGGAPGQTLGGAAVDAPN